MILGSRVNFIEPAETLSLRQRILRPLSRLEECVFPADFDPTTFHLGVFHAGLLVSIGTFVLQSHPELSAGFPYRLRGMASDEKYRGRGFGGILLRQGVNELKSRRADLLWFNARVGALDFYRKQGFVARGPLFDLPGTGPHKVMYKHLIPR